MNRIPQSELDRINKKLFDSYGEINNKPRFRVVFSEDELEKRWTNYTDEGFELLHPEVRLLPKYRQYKSEIYILERLIELPDGVQVDVVERLSYEPLWEFKDKQDNPLPPKFIVCDFVIEQMYANMRGAGMYTKYTDPSLDPEEKQRRFKELYDAMWGNETNTGDALAHGDAIVVPRNYEGDSL